MLRPGDLVIVVPLGLVPPAEVEVLLVRAGVHGRVARPAVEAPERQQRRAVRVPVNNDIAAILRRMQPRW